MTDLSRFSAHHRLHRVRLVERLRLLDGAIGAVLAARRYEPPPAFWIHGDDESIDYCEACADILADELRAKAPEGGGEIVVEGTSGCNYDDRPAICERCGKLLDYDLTDDGACSEIAQFLETVEASAEPAPAPGLATPDGEGDAFPVETAYEIGRLLSWATGAAWSADYEEKLEKPFADIIGIAAGFLGRTGMPSPLTAMEAESAR